MKKSKAYTSFLKLLFTDTKNLLKELLRYTSESDRRIYVQQKLGLRNGLPFVDLNELIPDLNEEITNCTFLDGTSHPIDVVFIKSLCSQFENCNYLEIGSWRGESLYNVSQVAEKCVSLSFSGDEIVKRFGNKKMASLLNLFSKNLKNVQHVEADSLTFNFESLNQKFDIIFVDGDHSYEGVKSDTQNAFKLLKNDSSIIIFHDCGVGYEDNRYEVVAGILDGTPPEKRKFIYRVSNTLCGIYTKRKLNILNNSSPQTPNKVFTVKINSNPFNFKIN